MTNIRQYTAAVFEAEEGGYWAEVLELPGCVAQGEDLAELQATLPTAIEVWEDIAREIAAEHATSPPLLHRKLHTVTILTESPEDGLVVAS